MLEFEEKRVEKKTWKNKMLFFKERNTIFFLNQAEIFYTFFK